MQARTANLPNRAEPGQRVLREIQVARRRDRDIAEARVPTTVIARRAATNKGGDRRQYLPDALVLRIAQIIQHDAAAGGVDQRLVGEPGVGMAVRAAGGAGTARSAGGAIAAAAAAGGVHKENRPRDPAGAARGQVLHQSEGNLLAIWRPDQRSPGDVGAIGKHDMRQLLRPCLAGSVYPDLIIVDEGVGAAGARGGNLRRLARMVGGRASQTEREVRAA